MKNLIKTVLGFISLETKQVAYNHNAQKADKLDRRLRQKQSYYEYISQEREAIEKQINLINTMEHRGVWTYEKTMLEKEKVRTRLACVNCEF